MLWEAALLASGFDVFCFLVSPSCLGLCVFAEPALFSKTCLFITNRHFSEERLLMRAIWTVIHLTVMSHVLFFFALFSHVVTTRFYDAGKVNEFWKQWLEIVLTDYFFAILYIKYKHYRLKSEKYLKIIAGTKPLFHRRYFPAVKRLKRRKWMLGVIIGVICHVIVNTIFIQTFIFQLNRCFVYFRYDSGTKSFTLKIIICVSIICSFSFKVLYNTTQLDIG